MAIEAGKRGVCCDGPKRVFAYCHDSVGIGHLCRTLAICRRVSRAFPSSSFLVATGTPYVSLFRSLPNVDYIKLPAMAKVSNHEYESKFLTMAPEQLIRCRQAILLETIQHFEPDVMLVDKAPVGVRGELLPSLRWLRKHRPETRVIFGMRDIEDEQAATIAQWSELNITETLEEWFDEIWVYGTKSLFDVGSEYILSSDVRDKLSFMGYIAQEPCGHSVTPTPSSSPAKEQVLVTVGGGTDGEFLLRRYLEKAASQVSNAGFDTLVVGGPDLPTDTAESLSSLADSIPNVEWTDFEPCMDCRMVNCRLVVCMGGYNTLSLLARNRQPALVVPRTTPRLEQLMRARLWADRGALQFLHPSEVSADTLNDRVLNLLGNGCRLTSPDLDLNGLERVCARFESLWRSEPRHAHPVRM